MSFLAMCYLYLTIAAHTAFLRIFSSNVRAQPRVVYTVDILLCCLSCFYPPTLFDLYLGGETCLC